MSKDPKEVWGKSHVDIFKKIVTNCGVRKCKGPEAEVSDPGHARETVVVGCGAREISDGLLGAL